MKQVDRQAAEQIIDEDLATLELSIRQLKIQYDQFFHGSMKLPPTMLRGQVDRMVRKYVDTTMRTSAHRFRFNTLVTRFHAYCELWGRGMREQEEGNRPGLAARSQPQVNVQEQLVARTRVSDPQKNPDQLREIYQQFVATRERNGQKKQAVSFDKFVRGIAGQAARLRESSGCAEIELRLVVKNDQVQLKARPGD